MAASSSAPHEMTEKARTRLPRSRATLPLEPGTMGPPGRLWLQLIPFRINTDLDRGREEHRTVGTRADINARSVPATQGAAGAHRPRSHKSTCSKGISRLLRATAARVGAEQRSHYSENHDILVMHKRLSPRKWERACPLETSAPVRTGMRSANPCAERRGPAHSALFRSQPLSGHGLRTRCRPGSRHGARFAGRRRIRHRGSSRRSDPPSPS